MAHASMSQEGRPCGLGSAVFERIRGMTVKAFMGPLVWALFWIVCLGTSPAVQTNKRLWVLHEAGELTEFNPATFAPIQTVKIPVEALKNRLSLAINSRGEVLANPEPGQAADKVWFWDGRSAIWINRGAPHTTVQGSVTASDTEHVPQCFLSTDGRQTYWFENQFNKIKGADKGPDVSVRTSFLAWQIDLESGGRAQVANFSFAPCKCGTGDCSETCPRADFWIPDSGIDDFFIVTNWVPGQLGSTYQSSFLYRKAGGKWLSSKLPQVMERVLDAAQGGSIAVYSLLDSACCGRHNESNDQTVLVKNDKSAVIFDERQRYGNPDYDVSFFTTNAKLSPDLGSVAMTISSSTLPWQEIRLSERGNPDERELSAIRRAIEGLPAVDILSLGNSIRRSGFIPHATLIGWLSDREILVIENGFLVAFDVATGSQRKSQIEIPDESFVYVR